MLSVYALKPGFQNLLRPLVKRLASAGVTPNQVTIATALASVLLGLDLAYGSKTWLILPIFLPLRMALNAIDGMLAREYDMSTRLGAVLNEAMDLLSDAALTLPFATIGGISPATVLSATAAAMLVEIAGFARPGARRYEGPFGKSDRAVALGAAGTWMGLAFPISSMAVTAALYLWLLLCTITIINRFRRQ